MFKASPQIDVLLHPTIFPIGPNTVTVGYTYRETECPFMIISVPERIDIYFFVHES